MTEERSFSVAHIVQASIALLITVLLAMVGFFLVQANGTLQKTNEANAAFQTKAIEKIAELAGEFKATARELTSHKEEDRTLRALNNDNIRSFEHRLLTIERSLSPRSNLFSPDPMTGTIKP